MYEYQGSIYLLFLATDGKVADRPGRLLLGLEVSLQYTHALLIVNITVGCLTC